MPSLELLPTTATFVHPSSVVEQIVFVFTPTDLTIVKGIWLDFVNLTQDITIRVGYQIDGVTNRTFQTIGWTTGMDDGVLIEGLLPLNANKGLRLTLTSAVAEGASRNINYEIIREHLGAGAITFTYTVTNSVSGLPLDNVTVWVTTDVAGQNVIAQGVTNASGQVVFRLDAGTYYFFRERAGFIFTDPDTEVVSS